MMNLPMKHCKISREKMAKVVNVKMANVNVNVTTTTTPDPSKEKGEQLYFQGPCSCYLKRYQSKTTKHHTQVVR